MAAIFLYKKSNPKVFYNHFFEKHYYELQKNVKILFIEFI